MRVFEGSGGSLWRGDSLFVFINAGEILTLVILNSTLENVWNKQYRRRLGENGISSSSLTAQPEKKI